MKDLLKNKKLIIIVVAIVLTMLLGILYLLLQKEEEVPLEPASVVQPFNYDSYVDITIDEETANEDTEGQPGELPVFDMLQINHSHLVEFFVNKTGKSSWQKFNTQDIVYTWIPDLEEDIYLIDYDTAQDRAFFQFEEPVDLQLNPSGGVLSNAELDGYLQKFIQTYFGLPYTYMNVTVKNDPQGIRIEGNRAIEGVPVHTPGPDDFSDYIIITDTGDLLRGQILLMEHDSSGTNVDLVEPVELGEVINNPAYPKDLVQLDPIGWSFADIGYEPDEKTSPGFVLDAPLIRHEDLLEPVGTCEAQSVELVYYFVRSTEERFTPAYRINCLGDVTIEGKEYSVPIIVYSNAIDPTVVYVHPEAGE